MLNVMREQSSPVLQQTRPLPYDVVALVLQGGGALGAYQAGVYEGLHEAGIRPNWLAGISIGALNAAIIAGSPEAERVERLREFWETICAYSIEWPAGEGLANALPYAFDISSVRNALAATRALVQGQPGFFKPRFPPPLFSPFSGDSATSFYDTAPLHRTLEKLVDFDRLNSGEVRVSVGAVNVRTGNLIYFDTAERRLEPKHFMASGALSLLVATDFVAYLGWTLADGVEVSTAGYVAMAAGVLFSLIIGCGLMALVFYSSRSGYDEPAVFIRPDTNPKRAVRPPGDEITDNAA